MVQAESEVRAQGLVGRERECAEMDRMLDGARRGESGVLVLRADAGMGKSALLRHAADRAAHMAVLRVTGVEAESDLAFSGLHGLVWPIVGELARLPEPQHQALAAALGLARGEGRDRFLVGAGVLSLLAAAAEAAPILCVIDDAQWLDAPSADALVFAARRLVAEGVVMLFGAREGESRRFDAPGLQELSLSGLDHEAAAALLDRGSRALAPSVRERLLFDAAGNPLALLELPLSLSDGQLAGREALPKALPLNASLRAAFMQRIERLPVSTQEALLVAAAEDTRELPVILRAAAALELPSDALDSAEQAGLVEVDGVTLSFRHPLVRSAVYDSAPLGRRQRIHAALGDTLRAQRQDDRAVWHQAMATLTPDERIAAALEASGRESQVRGGSASAATAFERAAELSDGQRERGARLAQAAEAAWAAGQADRARALITRALPLVDRAQRAWLLGVSGVIEGQIGWLMDGVSRLQQAAAESEDASLKLHALRDACVMAIWAHDYEQGEALGSRAAEIPARTAADRFNVAAISAYMAELSGDYARGAALAAEATGLAERLDNPDCLMSASVTASRQGTAADGLRYASRAVDISRQRGLLTMLPFALGGQAGGLIGLGRFELAYATAEEGLRLAREIGQPWPAGWNLVHLAMIDALRGSEQLTRARAAEVQSLVARSGATEMTGAIERVLGLLNLGLGKPTEALERLLVVISTTRPESNLLFVFGVPDAVEAAVRADRVGEVAEHLRRFQNWVERFPNPARLALLARCRALVDDSDPEPHYAQSIELAGTLSPLDRARSELLYGEWLRRHRRRADARPHLRAALGCFEQLGARPWEARARSELRASGETARRRDPSTRDQLTPQELQIARLVAAGNSNPEIAAQLFLSPRTIDYHLRKVFVKLDISSRSELAEMWLGEPLTA